MTATYIALANTTLASAVSSITFGSIPATYRDLVVVFQGQSVGANTGIRVRLNGDTGTNYSQQRLSGNGTAASAATQTTLSSIPVSAISDATTTTAIQSQINIMDYSATDKHKMVLCRSGNATNGTEAVIGRWANTAAVTTVNISSTGQNYAIGTTVALYGIVS